MGIKSGKELPLVLQVSFDKLLMHYDEMAQSKDLVLANKAKRILAAQAPFPELREGFTDISLLEKHKDVIGLILEDTFPEALTHNEIKAASLPYDNVIFNSSERFKKIIKDAGADFELEIGNMNEDIGYITACTVILNFYYGFQLDFKRPFFYNIPDANGVMRHYRILYNADFIDLIPTGKAKKLDQNDVDELLANFDNLDLWKEKIPPNSFISKGFVISNMFDVTAEHSISEIKSKLISSSKKGREGLMDDVDQVFRSLFNLSGIRTGFTAYNPKMDQFEKAYGAHMQSFLLGDKEFEFCGSVLCQSSYEKLLKNNDYFAISNVDRFFEMSGGSAPFNNLKERGVKSAIFAPIAQNGQLLGVMELVSNKPNELNSINAQKLDDVMPFIVAAVQRSKVEEENLIDAVIQHECTTVHDSVLWKFKEEAKRFIAENQEGGQPSFGEIIFNDVHPLYGQIDIKNSSQARNIAIQRDLMIQLSEVNDVLGKAWQKNKLLIYEELMFRVKNHIDAIKVTLHTNSEQAIFDFVKEDIMPVFKQLKASDPELLEEVLLYESNINPDTDSYYDHRRNYDKSVMIINKKLAAVLDAKQENAQAMYPHYFERYKTDGIEHNAYIGGAITGQPEFDKLYLKNLRLWQLQTMCEMENVHYGIKPELPVSLDVASLILVYNTSLSIRFRMDEKRFDVDGTYNARYEIIKKRIDKSFIKGTSERLTQPGKMVIVYSQKKDEIEYLRYIKFLKSKGYFEGVPEIVDLEGLQGVSGLKAIRANILYRKHNKTSKKTYTYDELLEEIQG